MIYFNSISVEFEPRDVWVGCYWKTQMAPEVHAGRTTDWWKTITLYICILPLLPIILKLSWKTTPHVVAERK